MRLGGVRTRAGLTGSRARRPSLAPHAPADFFFVLGLGIVGQSRQSLGLPPTGRAARIRNHRSRFHRPLHRVSNNESKKSGTQTNEKAYSHDLNSMLPANRSGRVTVQLFRPRSPIHNVAYWHHFDNPLKMCATPLVDEIPGIYN